MSIFFGMLVWLFFFFFQAEDGIRDDLVTGVQTCALPISRPSTSYFLPKRSRRHARACPGHPRLSSLAENKTWMAGTSPAMTNIERIPRAPAKRPPSTLDRAPASGRLRRGGQNARPFR